MNGSMASMLRKKRFPTVAGPAADVAEVAWAGTAAGRHRGQWAVTHVVPVLVALIDGLVINGHSPQPERWFWIALAAAALSVRLRAPELALLAGLPGLFAGCLSMAPLIALYSVALIRRRRLVVAMGAAGFALTLVLSSFLTDRSALVFQYESPLLIFESLVLPAAAVTAGRAARIWRQRLHELRESQSREQRLLTERVLTAERNRLAREMHDVVAHKVSLISLQAGALQVGRGRDVDVQECAHLIQELSAQTVVELQHMLGVLRGAGADAGGSVRHVPRSRVADIAALAHASGLEVDLRVDPVPDGLPEAVEQAAYRTVQEALTNIRKHAPGAPARVRVDLLAGGTGLRVEVSNPPVEGAVATLPGGGRGLTGLRERADLLGGTFRAGRAPDGRFVVLATFPARQPVV
ncbi:sensor histidine kinase [Streptomyces lavendulae]|uniref:sensor histidine kinase n=1 Tax=Streptomyces lavendulae TaxID=1914 RepID=UPI0036C2979D